MVTPRLLHRRSLFCLMVLTGEEGPDLLQKRSAEHPLTDPFVREISRYHRLEEARHLSFARCLLPEALASASLLERLAVRYLGPTIMAGVFDSLVHPGVYRTVGLPGWRTWNSVRKSQARRDLRATAFRPILKVLRDAGAFGRGGRVPKVWRRACLVDAVGTEETITR
jgi:hypothetical protein